MSDESREAAVQAAAERFRRGEYLYRKGAGGQMEADCELLAEEYVFPWRPIETAPRDGTHVLLGWTTFTEPDVGYLGEDKWKSIDSTDYSYVRPPTHWMPLPMPPSE